MRESIPPLVTIGIPTHNRAERFLKEALESVLGQTYSNLEIIVSDNGSTDATPDLVEGYNDPRIRYHRHEPAVLPHESADSCLRKASGRYFLLLHDDDLIDNDFIECCVDALSGTDAGLARTGARVIDGEGNVERERPNVHQESSDLEFLRAILEGGAVTYFCNTLYNTRYLKAVGGFHSRAYTYQDVIATIMLAVRYGRVDLEAPKASYRIHGSKLGLSTAVAKWCEDSVQMIEVMSRCLPEHRDYFQKAGMLAVCRRLYNRAYSVPGIAAKVSSFFLVYRKCGFCFSPLDWIAERAEQRISRHYASPWPDGVGCQAVSPRRG